MINLKKGYENYKKINEMVKNIKDLDTLYFFIEKNKEFDITNDLRKEKGLIDFNYENICITIKQNENGLSASCEVEVWNDDCSLDFVYVNMVAYGKYRIDTRENGDVQVSKLSPYDEQEYYYSVGDKIYREGKFVEKIWYDKEDEFNNLTLEDTMILKLIEKNKSLNSICAIW